MKRYSIELKGTAFERLIFIIIFTIACFSIAFLPFAIVFLLTNLELVESPY